MTTSHWWKRCSTPITPQNPFKQDLDDVSQFFVRSEVKSNPFCSDSGFAEPTTPLATSASQPTVTVQSSNPFRRDETVSSDEKSSELSADRRIRKPVKVPEDFDGKQPLKEYLLHFERRSLINGWTEEKKAMFLAASLCGESRKLLSGLTESEGRQYTKIVERLQLRFGVEKQAELHQARLLNRRQFEGESLQMLATDIRSMVSYQDRSDVDGKIDLCSESCQQLSRRCVTRRLVTIEPHCEAVIPVHLLHRQSSTSSESANKGLRILEPCGSRLRDKALYVGRTSVSAGETGVVPVRILNTSDEMQTIGAQSVVAVAKPVTGVTELEIPEASSQSINSSPQVEENYVDNLPEPLKGLWKRSTGQLTEGEGVAVADLLHQYKDVFSLSEQDLGRTNLIGHQIDTGNARPIKQKP